MSISYQSSERSLKSPILAFSLSLKFPLEPSFFFFFFLELVILTYKPILDKHPLELHADIQVHMTILSRDCSLRAFVGLKLAIVG